MIPPERRALVATLSRRATAPGSRALLVGEPGIGRSRILELAVQSARAEGVLVLEVRASDVDHRPFHGLIGLLRTVPDRHLRALPREQREAVTATLARRAADLSSTTALGDGVVAVVRALVSESPVCLAVDDWPQLDLETTKTVRYVLDRFAVEGRAPSLVATQRLDEVLTGTRDRIDSSVFGAQDVLPLPSLTVDSLGAVVHANTGQRWGAAVSAELHRATGGNPRWAAELAGQQLAHLPGHVGVQLPASIADVLSARIGALTDRARYALTVVAALSGADPKCVLRLFDEDQVALVEARDAAVLRWSAEGLEPMHPIVGTAALAYLGHRRTELLRQQLYARLGRCEERTVAE